MTERLECLVNINGQDRKSIVAIDSEKIVNWVLGMEIFSGMTADEIKDLQFDFKGNSNYKLLAIKHGYTLLPERFNEELLGKEVRNTGVLIPYETLESILTRINEIAMKEISY